MAYPGRLKLASGPYTWTSTLAQRPFLPSRQVHGGGDESWAGVPEVWVDRRDRKLRLRPRFTEAEWSDLADVVERALSTGDVLTVWPEAADAGTSYETYLTSPKIGDELKPEPAEVGGFFELTLDVRTTDGSAIDPMYFEF
jgi:hypothetical protein